MLPLSHPWRIRHAIGAELFDALDAMVPSEFVILNQDNASGTQGEYWVPKWGVVSALRGRR